MEARMIPGLLTEAPLIKWGMVVLAVAILICMVILNDILLTVIPKVLKINSRSFVERSCCGLKYRLYVPDDYDGCNSEKFPLIVYLHGAGERGEDNSRQIEGLTQLGNGFNRQARAFRVMYPSFVYVPQCPENKTWSDEDVLDAVVQAIAEIRNTYSIDSLRLFLIGYSMGGSGTYSLATRYYRLHLQPVSGIIRLAGQGSFDRETHEIVSRSRLWLHIGLHDAPVRIERAREAFEMVKENRKIDAVKLEEVAIDKHPGITATLSIADKEVAKLTEYENDGHSISSFPFDDPKLLRWLFELKMR